MTGKCTQHEVISSCAVTGFISSALTENHLHGRGDCRLGLFNVSLLWLLLQVKEVREAMKDATVVLQHLHAFVSSVGPGGDWPAWVNAHLPTAGKQAIQASKQASRDCCLGHMHCHISRLVLHQ